MLLTHLGLRTYRVEVKGRSFLYYWLPQRSDNAHRREIHRAIKEADISLVTGKLISDIFQAIRDHQKSFSDHP